MDIIQALKTRASTRAFLHTPVSRESIEKILEAARWAPSSKNTQPWYVAVVQGDAKKRMSESLLNAFQSGQVKNPDYIYTSPKWEEPYKSRQFACGVALYGALGIGHHEKEKRIKQWEDNFFSFDAPVMIFFFIDQHAETGAWLDTGMFIQNVMLAAREFDLSTCAQFSLAEYPDIVREHLGEEFQDKIVICGMALGYADIAKTVNQYRTERESVDNFTKWYKN